MPKESEGFDEQKLKKLQEDAARNLAEAAEAREEAKRQKRHLKLERIREVLRLAGGGRDDPLAGMSEDQIHNIAEVITPAYGKYPPAGGRPPFTDRELIEQALDRELVMNERVHKFKTLMDTGVDEFIHARHTWLIADRPDAARILSIVAGKRHHDVELYLLKRKQSQLNKSGQEGLSEEVLRSQRELHAIAPPTERRMIEEAVIHGKKALAVGEHGNLPSVFQGETESDDYREAWLNFLKAAAPKIEKSKEANFNLSLFSIYPSRRVVEEVLRRVNPEYAEPRVEPRKALKSLGEHLQSGASPSLSRAMDIINKQKEAIAAPLRRRTVQQAYQSYEDDPNDPYPIDNNNDGYYSYRREYHKKYFTRYRTVRELTDAQVDARAREEIDKIKIDLTRDILGGLNPFYLGEDLSRMKEIISRTPASEFDFEGLDRGSVESISDLSRLALESADAPIFEIADDKSRIAKLLPSGIDIDRLTEIDVKRALPTLGFRAHVSSLREVPITDPDILSFHDSARDDVWEMHAPAEQFFNLANDAIAQKDKRLALFLLLNADLGAERYLSEVRKRKDAFKEPVANKKDFIVSVLKRRLKTKLAEGFLDRKIEQETDYLPSEDRSRIQDLRQRTERLTAEDHQLIAKDTSKIRAVLSLSEGREYMAQQLYELEQSGLDERFGLPMIYKPSGLEEAGDAMLESSYVGTPVKPGFKRLQIASYEPVKPVKKQVVEVVPEASVYLRRIGQSSRIKLYEDAIEVPAIETDYSTSLAQSIQHSEFLQDRSSAPVVEVVSDSFEDKLNPYARRKKKSSIFDFMFVNRPY
jgi:hypothetical protein